MGEETRSLVLEGGVDHNSPASTIPEDALIASSRADAVAQVKKINTSATVTSVNQVRGNTVTPGFWDVMVTVS